MFDLDALEQIVSEMAAQYQVHVQLFLAWKKQMTEQAATVFNSGGKSVSTKDVDAAQAVLFEQIGRLKMELQWFKIMRSPSCEGKRQQIEPNPVGLSVRWQCELRGSNRSSYDLEPASASTDDLALVERWDRLHLDHPELGSCKGRKLLGSPAEAVQR
jgi:putative transposase